MSASTGARRVALAGASGAAVGAPAHGFWFGLADTGLDFLALVALLVVLVVHEPLDAAGALAPDERGEVPAGLGEVGAARDVHEHEVLALEDADPLGDVVGVEVHADLGAFLVLGV